MKINGIVLTTEMIYWLGFSVWLFMIPVFSGIFRGLSKDFYATDEKTFKGERRILGTVFWPIALVTYVPYKVISTTFFVITRILVKTLSVFKYLGFLLKTGIQANKQS